MQKSLRYISGVFIVFLIFAGPLWAVNDPDNSPYASLLKKHVRHGRVDYDGFKKDEALLDDYLAVLSRTDTGSLSQNSQFAFYINAYNAFTIKLILTRYPGINSIKEISSFFSSPWEKKFVLLQGKTVSLDHIEHTILRPRFKDPRVHFAINCASKSCPPLRAEPYDGKLLDTQLDDQARLFINDKKNNFFKDSTLFISRIFKWFEEDFSDNPLMFIKQYADPELKKSLDSSTKKIKINYLYYDWSLNR